MFRNILSQPTHFVTTNRGIHMHLQGLTLRYSRYIMFPMDKEPYMFLKPNVGVMLPKQTYPYILDGKDQPKSIKRVFVTPQGYFPRMADITMIYGRSRREVEDRRMRNPRPRFDDWYVITSPTVEDAEKAIENVNRLYVEVNTASDHCPLCNRIDDLLLKKGCWLVSTTHDCGKYAEELNPEIIYSYMGSDYKTDLDQLMNGDLDHMEVL